MSSKTGEYQPRVSASGSLLSDIQRLLAPPGPKTVSSDADSDKWSENDWKRPRAVNHTNCDACGDDGDLLCCDRCPASFHPECLNPPLDKETAPTSEWYCHNCSITLLEEFKQNAEDLAADEEPPQEVQNLFSLVEAAKKLNPKEFSLPQNFSLGTSATEIPGGYKSSADKNPRSVELELGSMVPLPARCCLYCKENCRKAALLQCDYCPLCYHLDCLDPPLSIMPSRTERWMCPNHVEQAIDSFMVTSSRLSERVALWDKFARSSLDHQQVKVDFLRKSHLYQHIRKGRRGLNPRVARIAVPPAIKHQYKCPPSLHYKDPRLLGIMSEEERCALSALEKLSQTSDQQSSEPKISLAVLHCVNKPEVKFYMTAPVAHIGLSDANDFSILSELSLSCRYVSDYHHAAILYDPYSRVFELINYSEFGTAVDGVFYSPDIYASLMSYQPEYTELNQDMDKVLEAKDTDDKQKKRKIKMVQTRPRDRVSMNVYPPPPSLGNKVPTCRCLCPPTALQTDQEHGWEGSAIVNHGSIIKLGCLFFVFCVVDNV